MTTHTGPPAAPAARASARRWLDRHRSSLVLGVGVLLALVVAVVLGGGGRTDIALDPGNPGRNGAKALAQVLDDQGVDVTVVRSAAALEDTEVRKSSTVLVTSTENLGPSTITRLRDHVGDARLILVMPPPPVTDELGYRLGSTSYDETVLSGGCKDAALGALLDDLSIEVTDTAQWVAAAGCYFGDHGARLAQPEPRVLLLGVPDILTNSEILKRDNAAAALRLLGQDDELTWYVPDATDLAGTDVVGLAALLPRWVKPMVWLAALGVISLMLWRGRRLGRLATEPLPVVVRAIETTRSRGRLYRKVNDRGHAAGALRTAARTAVAERLGLPTGTDPESLARQVAQHTGRPLDQVRFWLLPDAPVPPTDPDLITLANDLAALDREVRRT